MCLALGICGFTFEGTAIQDIPWTKLYFNSHETVAPIDIYSILSHQAQSNLPEVTQGFAKKPQNLCDSHSLSLCGFSSPLPGVQHRAVLWKKEIKYPWAIAIGRKICYRPWKSDEKAVYGMSQNNKDIDTVWNLKVERRRNFYGWPHLET